MMPDASEDMDGLDIQFTIEAGGNEAAEDNGEETETETRPTATRPLHGKQIYLGRSSH